MHYMALGYYMASGYYMALWPNSRMITLRPALPRVYPTPSPHPSTPTSYSSSYSWEFCLHADRDTTCMTDMNVYRKNQNQNDYQKPYFLPYLLQKQLPRPLFQWVTTCNAAYDTRALWEMALWPSRQQPKWVVHTSLESMAYSEMNPCFPVRCVISHSGCCLNGQHDICQAACQFSY